MGSLKFPPKDLISRPIDLLGCGLGCDSIRLTCGVCGVCGNLSFDFKRLNLDLSDKGDRIVCLKCEIETVAHIAKLMVGPIEDLPLHINNDNIFVKNYITKKMSGKFNGNETPYNNHGLPNSKVLSGIT